MAQRPENENNDLGYSKRAEAELNALIEDADATGIRVVDARLRAKTTKTQETTESEVEEEILPEVTSEEALRAERIVRQSISRDRARLLILTRDVSVVRDQSLAQKRVLELATMFAEIHIIVLAEAGACDPTYKRLSENIWIYPTSSSSWWKTIPDAYRLAKAQLIFGEGFRPDIVIAEDPFESGIVGRFLARKYDRPFQVHVFEDIYDPTFADKDPHNSWRLWMAYFALRSADCVRTKSSFLKDQILAHYPHFESQTEVLPMYHNLSAWRDAEPGLDLHARYPQFRFIALHASSMSTKSHTDRIITGMARLLKQYGTVGLVIVGEGPEFAMLQNLVAMLGLEQKVFFEPMPDDLASYMKTADVYVQLSEDIEEDVFVLQAAAVGVPLITTTSGISGELFVNEQSTFVCPVDSPPCVGQKINAYLNQNQLRTRHGRAAKEIVFARIDQDYETYLRSYQNSILRCVIADA